MVTNEVLNTILSRKGVKQYKSNPVPRELLEAIVAAGIAAPNAFNRQAWHFSVITNKTLLEEIDAETNHRLGDEEGYHSLYGAPVLIVISSPGTITLQSKTAPPPMRTWPWPPSP